MSIKKYEQYSHFAVTYSCFQISGIRSLSLENIYTHDLYFVYQNLFSHNQLYSASLGINFHSKLYHWSAKYGNILM